jgi:hypothetical protein
VDLTVTGQHSKKLSLLDKNGTVNDVNGLVSKFEV